MSRRKGSAREGERPSGELIFGPQYAGQAVGNNLQIDYWILDLDVLVDFVHVFEMEKSRGSGCSRRDHVARLPVRKKNTSLVSRTILVLNR